MKPEELGSFVAFKELANKSLGLTNDDTTELVPLNVILARFEELYSLEVSRFDAIVDHIQRDEHYYKDLSAALEAFRRQLAKKIEIPESKLVSLQCVPVAEDVFNANTQSNAHRQFCTTYQNYYRFNVSRGNDLFDFMLACFLEESAHFRRLNRGMRSRVVSYAGSLESIYSIWESNQFGPVWAFPSDMLPKSAYASVCYRLIDGLCSALDFNATYEIFERHLNPLAKFPVQFLYKVIMREPKSLLQEYAQANRSPIPHYDICRVGGQDHAPEFQCKLIFRKQTYTGEADNKTQAEMLAASKAIEFLIENDRGKMLRQIEDTISSGMLIEEKSYVAAKAPPAMLVSLRNAVGASCSNSLLLRCLTLKVDVITYSLSASAANENLAFCGSWLALALDAEKYPGRIRGTLALHMPILACVQETRRNIFPRSIKLLANSQYMDVIQAILFAEFLQNGYAAVKDMFDRCIESHRKTDQTNALDQFRSNVPYTMLLQEYAQQFGPELASYHYVLTNPMKKHDPIFNCRAAYHNMVGEGVANSKKAARQKAAYELLKRLREVKSGV